MDHYHHRRHDGHMHHRHHPGDHRPTVRPTTVPTPNEPVHETRSGYHLEWVGHATATSGPQLDPVQPLEHLDHHLHGHRATADSVKQALHADLATTTAFDLHAADLHAQHGPATRATGPPEVHHRDQMGDLDQTSQDGGIGVHIGMGMSHTKPVFKWTTDVSILFEQWTATTILELAAAMLVAAAMAAVIVWLRLWFSNWNNQDVYHVKPPLPWWKMMLRHSSRSMLHALTVTLGYLQMLFVMTYDLRICVAILLGSGLGFFVLGPHFWSMRRKSTAREGYWSAEKRETKSCLENEVIATWRHSGQRGKGRSALSDRNESDKSYQNGIKEDCAGGGGDDGGDYDHNEDDADSKHRCEDQFLHLKKVSLNGGTAMDRPAESLDRESFV